MTIEMLVYALEMDSLALAMRARNGVIWPSILWVDVRSERETSSGRGILPVIAEFCGHPGNMRHYVADNRSKSHEVQEKCSVVSVRER